MATLYSPKIVTDGLVLALDAANQKSFTSNELEVEYLIVAGGGGGGQGSGGNAGGSGGGAGGVRFGKTIVTPQSYSITVGSGGTGVPAGSNVSTIGGVGGNSSAFSITSNGGGGGASYSTTNKVTGMNGGSGAGGHPRTTSYATGYGFGNTPSTDPPQGRDGGRITAGSGNFGGGLGGGGFNEEGQDGSAFGSNGARPGSNGGDGFVTNIRGIVDLFAGGGGGGGSANHATLSIGGEGGEGGGATGGNWSTNTAPLNSPSNTGGGGGGGAARGSANNAGGNGGSGIVIIRYRGPQKAKGGTVTQSTGWTIHTFTGSGNFEVGQFWGDLSLNENSGELVNGPTFDSSNGGSIVFDGVDDYINAGDCSIYFPAGNQSHNISLSFWVKMLGTNSSNEIFAGILFDNDRLYLGKNSGNWRFGWGVTSWSSSFSGNLIPFNSNWTFYTFNVVNGSATLFINGVQSITQTDTSVNLQNTFPIGGYFNGGSFLSAPAGPNQIALSQIYNRALSAEEILQNYNATKGRYGL
jgi:hypothetical protein